MASPKRPRPDFLLVLLGLGACASGPSLPNPGGRRMSLELGPRGVRFEGKEMELGAFGARIRALVAEDKKAGGEGIRLMVRLRPGMNLTGTETFLRLVQDAGVRAVDFL